MTQLAAAELITDGELDCLMLIEAAEKVMTAIDEAVKRGTLGSRTPIADARLRYANPSETPRPLKQLRKKLKAAQKAAKNAELEKQGILTSRKDSAALYELALEALRERCPHEFRSSDVREICRELGDRSKHESVKQRIHRNGEASFHKELGCWRWLR